jgi:ankyrin repeat protein
LPLILAARYNNPGIVEMLLDAGTEINKADGDGYTALMEAANCMASDSLRLLIQRGAQVNARSSIGATPLIYGVFALGEDFATPAPDDVVTILLANGADLKIRDGEGKSALDVARETDNEELVDFLLNAGAS